MMTAKKEKVLIIAAHPDDEVLGCGGTIARHSDEGDSVQILIIAEGATSRGTRRDPGKSGAEVNRLRDAAAKAGRILGCAHVEVLGLPDNRLDSLERLDLIKIIEAKIAEHDPSSIYTHHSGDVNIDHRLIHEAVITACRPTPGQRVRKLFSFEVASSTEWQPPGSGQPFLPNVFVDITNQLERKVEALSIYHNEMRDWPHARSIKAVRNQALQRGAQAGLHAAEAFCLLREIRW